MQGCRVHVRGCGERELKEEPRCGPVAQPRGFLFLLKKDVNRLLSKKAGCWGGGGAPQIGCTGAYAASPRKSHRGNGSQTRDLPLPLGLALPENAAVSHRLCFREETQRSRKC